MSINKNLVGGFTVKNEMHRNIKIIKPVFKNTITLYETEIFPVNLYIKFYRLVKSITGKYPDIYEKYSKSSMITYLTKKYYTSINSTYLQSPKDQILVNPLSNHHSLIYYDSIQKYGLYSKDKKILIISKNTYIAETLIYIKKYIYYDSDIKIKVILIKEVHDSLEYVKEKTDMLRRLNIQYIISDNKLRGDILDTGEKFDTIFINANIYFEDRYLRAGGCFQLHLNHMIFALEHLNNGGCLSIQIPNITKRSIYNFFAFIGNYFNKYRITLNKTTPLNIEGWLLLLYENYSSDSIYYEDMEKLKKISEEMYKYDPTGGYNFYLSDKKEQKLFIPPHIPKNKPEKFLDKIVSVDSDNIGDSYTNYKNYMIGIINKKINIVNDLLSIYTKIDNNQFMDKMKHLNMLKAVKLAREMNLEIVPWIDENGLKNNFYNLALRSIYNNINPYFEKFNYCAENISIIKSANISYTNKNHINNLYIISENAYKYIESADKNVFRHIRLLFNNYQKRLQKFLFSKHNININNSKVSRAWLKIYELYYETKYFDNMPETVNAFHLCEAPGNFVNSTEYFVNRMNKTYKWNAQSLKTGLSDQYGFMKNTQNRWDFGRDNLGDATSYDNLEYYYKKYKGIDSFVGDCGIEWSENTELRDKLSIFQIIYALLLPKVGGNFIIKTYTTNYSIKLLSYLALICSRYDKMFIYRSSRNIWTSEVYIVGINNKGLRQDEIDLILSLAKEYSTGNFIYPIKYIPTEFGYEYEYHIKNMIDIYSDIKKIWTYMARRKDIFDRLKGDINVAINKKNKLWLQRYIPHISDSVIGYDKFVNNL